LDFPNIVEKSFLIENKENLNLQGNGTKNDPIIIDEKANIPVNLIFKTDDLYIFIKNTNIGFVVFDKCKNITIEDSIVLTLKMKSCQNITVQNNIIKDIKNYYGFNIIVENNRIHSFSNVHKFVVWVLIISVITGISLLILSYILDMYILRNLTLYTVAFGAVIFFYEFSVKKTRRFIDKKFKNNDFSRDNIERFNYENYSDNGINRLENEFQDKE